MTSRDFLVYLEDVRGLIGVSEKDFETLRAYRDFFLKHQDDLVQLFYDTLFTYPATAKIFREGERPQREETLRGWFQEVLDGHDTPDFWKRQYGIALAHIRRGVLNRYMIAITTKMKEFLLTRLIQESGDGEVLEVFMAFQRILDATVALTTTLVDVGFSRCIQEATGWTEQLIENMRRTVFDRIAREMV